MASDDKSFERYFKDWPLIALITAFIAVLIAFFRGAMDYPIGCCYWCSSMYAFSTSARISREPQIKELREPFETTKNI